jgi:hypothetical protein
MAFCQKCGGANDPTSAFCGACGTALAAASAGITPGAAVAPAAAKKKGNKWLMIVGIIAAVFVGLPVVITLITAIVLSFKSPAKNENRPAAPPPTAEELTNAQRAGLSKEFATAAWLTHRYVGNAFTHLVMSRIDEDIKQLPSDEAIRDGLKATKSSIRNAADRLAFDRMYALLWIVHTSPNWKPGEAWNPVYERHSLLGSDCLLAVLYSFGQDVGDPKDFKNCVAEQRKLRAAEGKGDWDDL